jgi:hypothetical protein
MQARSLFATLAVSLITTTAIAQTSIWTPSTYAAAPGNSNNIFPWGWTSSADHYEQIYGAVNFTGQSVNAPVVISRLRWRAWATTGSWAGGTFPTVTLNMSTAAVPYTAASSNFAANHGGDLATVYSGPVTVLGGAGAGLSVPGPVVIDITLSSPFLYDPNVGDLCMEMQMGGGFTGAYTPIDAASGVPMTRIYELTSATSAAGTVGTSYGLITEFTYLPASGYASYQAYGTGCYDSAVSFYENFTSAPSFDLGGSPAAVNSILMVPNGQGGYTVVPGGNSWWTPVGANLGLGDDTSSSPITTSFSFPYPGGSTNSIIVSSNGVVGLSATGGTLTGYPSPGTLLSEGARFAPYWTDLDPSSATGAGTVILDDDAPNGVVYITWTAVPCWEAVPSSPRFVNTFQVALHSNGNAEFRYQTCSAPATPGLGVLVGFSPGGTSRDPGNRDLSVAIPFSTATDHSALALAASARPVIGSTINLVTTNIPAGTAVGARILSFTQHNPGIDLASIGMPGCRQYVGLDSSLVFLVSGTSSSSSLGIPNNTGLAGLHVYSQTATFSAGFNPLGVVSSNGLQLKLDVN